MADEKKPILGKVTPVLGTTASAPKPVLGNVVSLVPPAVMTEVQFERLRRSLLVGLVTAGYLSNGGRPTTPARELELKALIDVAERLI